MKNRESTKQWESKKTDEKLQYAVFVQVSSHVGYCDAVLKVKVDGVNERDKLVFPPGLQQGAHEQAVVLSEV